MSRTALFLTTAFLLGALLAPAPAPAQSTQHSQAQTMQASTANATGAHAAASLDPLLAQLDQFADSTRLNLARLRIEKWKTESEMKRQAQADAQSVDRNLSQALPTLVTNLRQTPQSLMTNFVMYRNLNALHDVVSSLAEAAGAFGNKEEYRALAQDVSRLDDLRRAFADRLETISAQKDAEIARLQAQLRSQLQSGAAADSSAPKKIIVDDQAPPKPKSRARKPAAKPKSDQAATPPQ